MRLDYPQHWGNVLAGPQLHYRWRQATGEIPGIGRTLNSAGQKTAKRSENGRLTTRAEYPNIANDCP